MKYFNKLDLENIELLDDLNHLLDSSAIHWNKHRQICLNTTINEPTNYELGTGSLILDWDNRIDHTEFGKERIELPARVVNVSPADFTVLCDQFKGTAFERAYAILTDKFDVGRVRLMNSLPKTCYTWHTDYTPRIHLPISTQEGCFMVIEDEIMHLPRNTWWMTDTTKSHTAFNGSKEFRIHLVAEIL